MSGDLWSTPWWLFRWAEKEYGPFDCDVCANSENTKVQHYITETMDGLNTEWGMRNWCNPPYSKPLPWIEKAIAQKALGKDTCMLVKADRSTKAFRLIWDNACVIIDINHRIKFVGAKQVAPFPVMFVMFNHLYSNHFPLQRLVNLREYIET